ncbi:integration host factor subunit beta [Ferrovum sp.]|uniref:integration host factor subunit beta n=1 Tax=Ferrovum sp. TaxID=2609467 RepID=UPI002638FA2A|nr:integration host factor subunit beta [Ferrovum sp.]
MTKSELIDLLASHYPQLVARDAEMAVKTLLDSMGQCLTEGQRIEIRGFGSFGLNHRPARQGRNPKTGEKVHVPEKFVPHFKPGKDLRDRVDLTESIRIVEADGAGDRADRPLGHLKHVRCGEHALTFHVTPGGNADLLAKQVGEAGL